MGARDEQVPLVLGHVQLDCAHMRRRDVAHIDVDGRAGGGSVFEFPAREVPQERDGGVER